MRRTALMFALLIVAQCLVGTESNAACGGPFVDEFHDLDDNLIPDCWTQEIILNGPGVSDGALRGRTTDGGAWLHRQGTMPAGATGIKLEYDGNLAYSYWGHHHFAAVKTLSGDMYWVGTSMAQYNYGSNIRIRVGGPHPDFNVWSNFPLEYGDSHNTVVFYDDRITYKVVRYSPDDGFVLCDLDVAVPGLQLDQIAEISFYAGTTTNNNAWSDNLSVTLLAVKSSAYVDIKPGSCPNPLNVKLKGRHSGGSAMGAGDPSVYVAEAKGGGVLPIAILGTADLDITTIDPSTVELVGIAPIRWSIEDVGTPVDENAEECECSTAGPDGYDDLTLKFDRTAIIEALGEVEVGDIIPLTVTFDLNDGTCYEGTDCVVIVGPKPEVDSIPVPDDDGGVVVAQNYPNPFNPVTEISFNLPRANHVRLEIFNSIGQKVASLVDMYLEAGEHTATWDGTDAASGIYLYRLEAGDFVDTKKMILLK